jgi:hypothetical protein
MSLSRSMTNTAKPSGFLAMLVIVTLLFTLFPSCATYRGTVPKPKSNDDTLLVIKLDREQPGKIFADYILHTSEGVKIKISTKRNYIFVRGLSYGEYTITRMQSIYREAKSFGSIRDLKRKIPFVLMRGRIEILNYVLQVDVTDDGQRAMFSYLDKPELMEIRKELVDYINYDQWEGFRRLF